jgi:3',5'-cyclic AMP phosphodiesterase CpdA
MRWGWGIGVAWLLTICAGCVRPVDAVDPARRPATPPAGDFLVKPVLQWGDSPDWNPERGIQVLWQTEDTEADWTLEVRTNPDGPWRPMAAPRIRRIAVAGVPAHRLYRASATGIKPGVVFLYRLKRGDSNTFQGQGRAPKPAGEPHRFVVFGDCGVNSSGQKAIAYQAYQARPDYVMITGDIVYDRGRIFEYRQNFWPVYNADQADPSSGAPLLRSIPFLAAPGNHDIGSRDLDRYPDGLAYFLYWSQPLNGPAGAEGSAHVPLLTGSETNQRAFREAAGDAYPRMGNFSFNYGNAHWMVLDANPYVDWSDPRLREWVRRDLAAARSTWTIVALHQPPFNSARKHSDEQNTRRVCDLLESGGVDLVFCGHVHNYQRTFPLRFKSNGESAGPHGRSKELVAGQWKLDRDFDGVSRTHADGVIYLVTGGGGASLYNPEQQDDPSTWQEFTCKFVAKVHSLTVADVQGSRLTIRQLSPEGQELDRFTLTK